MISVMKWNDLRVQYTTYWVFVKLLNTNYKGPRRLVRIDIILN